VPVFVADLNNLVETIINHLPYSDGSARRRMFAGGVLLIGLSIPYGSGLASTFGLASPQGTPDLQKLTSSPLLLAAFGVSLYLTGTLIELLADMRWFRLPDSCIVPSIIRYGLRSLLKRKRYYLRCRIRSETAWSIR
jgi:hypothetical protein